MPSIVWLVALGIVAPAQDPASGSIDLQSADKELDDLSSAVAKAKSGRARHEADLKFRSAALSHAPKVTEAAVRTPKDAAAAARILLAADRGKEAMPYLVRALSELRPKPPAPSKPNPKPPPKPTPKTTERDRKTKPATEGLPGPADLEKGMADMMGHLDLIKVSFLGLRALRCEHDEGSLLALLEALHALPVPTNFHVPGAVVMPLSLLAIRGVPADKLAGIARRYRDHLDEKSRRMFDAEMGLIGTKAAFPEKLGFLRHAGPDSRPSLAGKVTIIGFIEPGTAGDQALRHLKDLVANGTATDLSVITCVYLSGGLTDPARDRFQESSDPALGEEEELRLLAEYRDALQATWPWIVAGRWKAPSVRTREDEATKPDLFRKFAVNFFPTFVVTDRTATIRYFHTGSEGLGVLDEVVGRLLREEAAATREQPPEGR